MQINLKKRFASLRAKRSNPEKCCFIRNSGLLRFARNDGHETFEGTGSQTVRGVKHLPNLIAAACGTQDLEAGGLAFMFKHLRRRGVLAVFVAAQNADA